VACAGVWDDKATNPAADLIEQVPMSYDWTYTTAYLGSASFLGEGKTSEQLTALPTTEELDMELLKRRDPVYWFDNVLLYEDELHDNGISHVSVKVRVMPTFWLVLLRSWLRVDGVVVRVKDVRIFHKFGTSQVFREVQSREVKFADMPKYRLPMDVSMYRDVDQFYHRIPLQHTTKQIFNLSHPEPSQPSVSTLPSTEPQPTPSESTPSPVPSQPSEQMPTKPHPVCEACVMWIKS
jgi:type 2A phosphatase activator TIP41